MCCTFNKAEMFLTVLGLFISEFKHTIFYQAVIQPEDRNKYTGFLGALPKVPGTQVTAIDADEAPEFLSDLAEEALSIGKGELLRSPTLSYSIPQVIETKNYYFVIAENIDEIPVQVDLLYDEQCVRTQQREYVKKEALLRLKETYGEEMAFFIALRKPELNESVEFKPVPFGFTYQPKKPNLGFFPGLDDHTGNGARPGLVNVAHTLVLGVQKKINLPGVYWEFNWVDTNLCTARKTIEAIPLLQDHYPSHVKAWLKTGQEQNGDWVVNLSTMELRRVPMDQIQGLYAIAYSVYQHGLCSFF